jgi:hypothetical protein
MSIKKRKYWHKRAQEFFYFYVLGASGPTDLTGLSAPIFCPAGQKYFHFNPLRFAV